MNTQYSNSKLTLPKRLNNKAPNLYQFHFNLAVLLVNEKAWLGSAGLRV